MIPAWMRGVRTSGQRRPPETRRGPGPLLWDGASLVGRRRRSSGDRSTPGPGAAGREGHSGAEGGSRRSVETPARGRGPGHTGATPGDSGRPVQTPDGARPPGLRRPGRQGRRRLPPRRRPRRLRLVRRSRAGQRGRHPGGAAPRLPPRHAGPPNVSSSAVFPLETSWPEETFGRQAMRSLGAQPRSLGADGYSLSKLGAELLLWSACERGLPVTVVRGPAPAGRLRRGNRQLTGPPDRGGAGLRPPRGCSPRGTGSWQLAPVDAVCRELVSNLQTGPSPERPVRHLAMEPLRAGAGAGRPGAGLRNRARAPAAARPGQRPDRRGAKPEPAAKPARAIRGPGRCAPRPSSSCSTAPGRPSTSPTRGSSRKRTLPGNPAALFLHSIGREPVSGETRQCTRRAGTPA